VLDVCRKLVLKQKKVSTSAHSQTAHITYKRCKEMALVPGDDMVAAPRTNANAFGELSVQSEQEVLLSSLRTALHPLPLREELYAFGAVLEDGVFGRLLDFDNLFSAILGEEDT
jgi:hypothetical protein